MKCKLLHDVLIRPVGRARERIGEDGYLTKKQFDYMLKVFSKDSFKFCENDSKATTEYRKYLYYTCLNTLFYTGLRKSEMFGLKWCDISEETFKVERNLKATQLFARIKNTEYREVTPKTINSTRENIIPSSLKIILNDWKLYCESIGKNISSNDYIFVETDGCHFKSTTFDRRFNKIVECSGVCEKYNKNINVHSLRHSNCSYLISEMVKMDSTLSLYEIQD